MNIIDSIQQRRAVKYYDPKHEMTADEINQLMLLAKLAPTAFNQQNIRFVIVSDQQLRQQIRVAAYDQVQVTDASLLIVLCADTKAWEKDSQRYWDNAPVEIQNHMNKAIDVYYRGKKQV